MLTTYRQTGIQTNITIFFIDNKNTVLFAFQNDLIWIILDSLNGHVHTNISVACTYMITGHQAFYIELRYEISYFVCVFGPSDYIPFILTPLQWTHNQTDKLTSTE